LKYIPNILTNVVDYLPKDKNHILMAVGGFTYSGEPTVVKVSFNSSGKTRVYQASVSDISSWITDVQHHVRIGIYKDKTKFKIMEQNSSNGTLRELWQFEVFSADAIWPMGFALDPNILYVKALYKGKDAIFKVDLTDPKLTKKLVFYYENYDVGGGLRYSKVSGDVIGVGSHFFDSSYIKFQASLDKALPDTENHLVSLSEDERKYIILATNDTEPGVYLLGDRDTNSLGLLAYQYKKLTADVLSEKQTITYKARDGLSIEGFVTLPLHGAKKNLPTVIFPHGGPISFDNGSFDYWMQFFANQGYAVLQMNFRGSSGYGFDFMKQGLAS